MIPTESETRDDKASQESPGLVVELLGPAAAGKSSLLHGLTQSNESFVVGVRLRIRNIGHIPYFASNALLLLPTFLRQYGNDRWFTWEEIKMLVYLRGWHHVLRRQAVDGTIIILDQGPVFKLTRLYAFGPENMRRQSFDRWWDSMLKQWSLVLETVIWLDAPDATLLNRIRSRTSWHEVKDMSEQEGLRFLARYRRSYEEVISKLAAISGTKVVRLNSDQNSIRKILIQALVSLKQ